MRSLFRWVYWLRGIALAGAILISGAAQAAITGKIVGRVTDANRTPLPGTAVVVEGRRLGATTDPDGQYFILQVSPGTYTLEAHLVGYQPVRQQGVVVNLDRTTRVDFVLSESAIEVEAITVTASRPVVEQDVTSSQIFITTEQAQNLPVNTLLDALAVQPGISIVNKTAISVRGSTPDEISFQVDGFTQGNPIENRSYTSMNQAMVQEVQLLTGAFNAEYASRAAVVNVVTKDPGQIPTLAGDFRIIPSRQQHFGPDAYADTQFDRLLYTSAAGTSTNGRLFGINANGDTTDVIDSDKPVFFCSTLSDHAEKTPYFIGWDDVTYKVNYASWQNSDTLINATRGFWTKDALKQVWDWQHRAYNYHDQSDYYLDVATTLPIYVLPRTGLVVGFKDQRSMLPFPAIVQAFTDRLFEATLKSAVVPTIKFEGRARYEVVRTTIDGSSNSGYEGTSAADLNIFFSGDQSSTVGGSVGGVGTTLLGAVQSKLNNGGGEDGQNKYNLASNVPYKETIWAAGARLTHTLSPSTYYTLSYEHGQGAQDTHHGRTRNHDNETFMASDFVGKPLSEIPPWLIQNKWLKADGSALNPRTAAEFSNKLVSSIPIAIRSMLLDGVHMSQSGTGSSATATMLKDTTITMDFRTPWVQFITYKASDLVGKPLSEIPPSFTKNGKYISADGKTLVRDTTIIVGLDEAPNGFLGGQNSNPDILSRYLMRGGGQVSDYSEWWTDQVRFDFFSQINASNAMKFGAEYNRQHLIKDYRRIMRSNGMNGHWDRYDVQPWQAGFYVQDKMEFEGLVANFGARLDAWDANGIILFPDKRYPDEFKRGMLVSVLRDLGVNPSDYSRDELTYIDSPRTVDPGWALQKMVEQVLPHAYSKNYWRVAPRLGISHPIGTSTKFFFNFGWMYSNPKAGYRYGYNSENAQIGTSGSEIRGEPNPNLEPPRTVVYEVGFEQSLQNTYVVRAKGYSKDDEDEPGGLRLQGLGSSRMGGGPGRKSMAINTFANNQYQSYRGLEFTIEKARGRFITGSFNFDFRVITIGQNGVSVDFEDLRTPDPDATTFLNQPQFQPTSHVNVVLRSPNDWGAAAGSWSLSVQQTYSRGSKGTYYPEGVTTNPKVYRWVDTWRTDMRLQKYVNFGGRSVSFYMDVRNLFNQERVNLGALADPATYYKQQLMDGTEKFVYKMGDPRFNDILQRRQARDNDWLLFLDPREFQFGVRVNL